MSARKYPQEADTIITDPKTGLPVLRDELRPYDTAVVMLHGDIQRGIVWASSRDAAEESARAMAGKHGRVAYASAAPAPYTPHLARADEDFLDELGMAADRAALIGLLWLCGVIVSILALAVFGPDVVDYLWGAA